MERPEAQDSGSIILSGFKSDIVLNAIQTVIEEHTLQDTHHSLPFEYKIQNTSWRVVKLILGNTKLSNKWWGINS
jgi:UDP-N-acetylglucosamine 2-epimerase (non-hydrolysing)